MGKPFYEHLDGAVWSCGVCRIPLAKRDSLASKAFHARSGRAYLFHACSNLIAGPREERMMTTGLHLVSDVFCVSCANCVGWRYEFAFEKSQKYKENKVILERSLIVKTTDSDDVPSTIYNDDSDSDCDHQ